MHYYQQQMFYEQKLTTSRLTYLERLASLFCGSDRHGIHEPIPIPTSSRTPNSWDRNYQNNEGASERYNSWEPKNPWEPRR